MKSNLLTVLVALATLAPLAAADHVPVPLVDDELHDSDLDDDGIPDLVEAEVCGPSLVRGLLDTAELHAGLGVTCASPTDLDYGDRSVTVNLPSGVFVGPDADGDGLPANVTLQFSDVTLDASGREVRRQRTPLLDQDQLVDPDDANADLPVQRVFEATLPGGVFVGPDADGDGVPANVTVQMFDTVVNTLTGAVTRTRNAGADDDRAVDADDADPNVPVQRILVLLHPSGIVSGADADGDGVPATATIEMNETTVSTLDGSVSSARSPADDVEEVVDPDDADPNVPAQRIFTFAHPSGAAHGLDADGDGLPASATVESNDTTVDTRDGSTSSVRNPGDDRSETVDADDADPNVPVQRIFVFSAPSGVVPGADADGDGAPETVTVEFNETTVDTRDGSVVSVRKPADDVVETVDSDDADPNAPVQRILLLDAPCGVTLGPDADGDAVNATVTLEACTYEIDTLAGTVDLTADDPGDMTETLDADDADPNVPLQRLFVEVAPCGVTPGADADGDNLLATVTVESCTWTVDTRDGSATPVANDPGDTVQPLDVDDADPNVPVRRVFEETAPCNVAPGADADDDDLVATMTVEACDYQLDSRDGAVAAPRNPAADDTRVVDADDGDPNVPVQRVFTANVPSGATPGGDGDADGVPASATVTFDTLTLDTRDGTTGQAANPGASQTANVDTNDANPDAPLPCGTGFVVPLAAPTVDPVDADGDGIAGGFAVSGAGKRVRVCGNGVFQADTPAAPITSGPGPDTNDANACAPVACPIFTGNNQFVTTLRALDASGSFDGWASTRATSNAGQCAPVVPPCFRFEAALWDMNCEPVPFAQVSYRYRMGALSASEFAIEPKPNPDNDNVATFSVPLFYLAPPSGTNNVVAYFHAFHQTPQGGTIDGYVNYVASRLAPDPALTSPPQPDLPCRVADALDRQTSATPFLVNSSPI